VTAFKRFPELPRDIRLMIWKVALPPQIVELWQRNLKVTAGEGNWNNCPENAILEERMDYYIEYDDKGNSKLENFLGFCYLTNGQDKEQGERAREEKLRKENRGRE